MRHLVALTIKFFASLGLLYVILGLFFNVPFSVVFFLTLALGVTSYLLGDMLLLPRTNNTVATISDLALSFIFVWFSLANMATFGTNLFVASLSSAIGVAAFEYFFHKYLVKNSNTNEYSIRTNALQYQTETSEELTPRTKNNDNRNDTNTP